MDICIEMLISYLFLVLAFNIIDLGEAQIGCDDQLLYCGAYGPAIRFPFRLSSQPEQCGYPGFDLSCTDTNHTVLNLPISVKLFVKEIDYKSQVIQLYNPHHYCYERQLRRLNLAFSPFQFEVENDYYYLRDFALFNCSPSSAIASYDSYPISCLSGPTYQVYAFGDGLIADLPIIPCTKMYNLLSIPYSTIIGGIIGGDDDKIVRLKWSKPECGHCEVKGKKCRLKNNSTECFRKDTKGTYYCLLSNIHL
jgi:hypothetical protein